MVTERLSHQIIMIKYLFTTLFAFNVVAKDINDFPKLIEKMYSAQGNFSQKVIDQNGNLVQKVSGIFSFKKPNFFRWKYTEPFKSQIISDGELLYLYDPDLKQVVISSLDKLGGVSPAMLLVSGDTHNSFKLNYLKNIESRDWFQAIPKDKSKSTFKSVLINFESEKINGGLEVDFLNFCANKNILKQLEYYDFWLNADSSRDFDLIEERFSFI